MKDTGAFRDLLESRRMGADNRGGFELTADAAV
jgi:hypothetical protein